MLRNCLFEIAYGALLALALVVIVWATSKNGQNLNFATILLGGYAVAVAAFYRLGREVRKLCMAVTGSALVSLYVFEVYLVMGIEPAYTDPRKRGSQIEIIRKLRKDGSKIYPTTYPSMFYKNTLIGSDGVVFAPIGTISNVNSIACEEDGKFLTFRSDRHGFHNADELWEVPEWDAVLVGDSFTFGSCVDSDKGIAKVIEQTTGKMILNLGVGGGGPLIYLAALREYVIGRRALKVVWIHYEGNDVYDLAFEIESDVYGRYLEPGFTQNLKERQLEIDQRLSNLVNERYVEALRRAKSPRPVPVAANPRKGDDGQSLTQMLTGIGLLRQTREFLNNRFGVSIFRFGKTLPPNHAEFEKVFTSFLLEARSAGIEVVMLYLPDVSNIRRNAHSHSQFHWVKDLARRKGVKFVTVSAEFGREQNISSLFGGGFGPHYSAKGYAIVARKLAEALGF